MNKDKQALCSGCRKVHYVGVHKQLALTAKGWWASDLLRRQNNRK